MPKGRRTSSALTARSRDTWQGIAVSRTPEEEEEEDSLDDAGEKDTKVVESLKGKVGVWKEFRAGKMVLQILDDGLRLNFKGKVPVPYKEVNNKSFIHNEDFGIGEIQKLLANGVLKEVH